MAAEDMDRELLAVFCKLLFVCERDILRLSPRDRALLYSFVNHAAEKHGLASWMDAYYSLPEVQR